MVRRKAREDLVVASASLPQRLSSQMKLRRLGLWLLFYFVLASIFLNQGRLGLDWHHDGYVLAPAIAASEGLVPNRDFYTQYGPGAHLIHGLWLFLTENTLIQLRYFNALLLALNFLLSTVILAHKLKLTWALLIGSCAALSLPTVINPMVPWPSVIQSTFYLLCLLTLTKVKWNSSKSDFFMLGLIGVLTGLVCYIRIHGLVLFIAILTSLIVMRKLSQTRPLIIGFILLVGLVTLVQMTTRSLNDFFEQIFIIPLIGYGGAYASDIKPLLVNLFLYILFPSFLAFFVFLSRQVMPFLNTRGVQSWIFPFSIVVSIFVTYFGYELGLQISNIPIEDRFFTNPVYSLYYLGEHLRLSLLFAAVGLVFWASLNFFRKGQGSIQSDPSEPKVRILYLAFAIATCTQLFPAPDQLHVWWISPVLIALAPYLQEGLENFIKPIGGVLIGILLVNCFHILQVNTVERRTESRGVVKGLEVPITMPKVDFAFIASQLKKGETYFHCRDGIFAVANGSYIAHGKDFVNWGPQTPSKATLPGLHFYCLKTFSADTPGELVWSDEKNQLFITKVE